MCCCNKHGTADNGGLLVQRRGLRDGHLSLSLSLVIRRTANRAPALLVDASMTQWWFPVLLAAEQNSYFGNHRVYAASDVDLVSQTGHVVCCENDVPQSAQHAAGDSVRWAVEHSSYRDRVAQTCIHLGLYRSGQKFEMQMVYGILVHMPRVCIYIYNHINIFD